MGSFGGILVGRFKYKKKQDYHRNKKIFIRKSVKALIPFKEGNQGLLNLHVALKGLFHDGKMGLQKGNFL